MGDDLFQSTPYHEADLEDEHAMISTKFSKFGSSTGLSPCTRQDAKSTISQEALSALKFRRKGYLTYTEHLRKDINRAEKGNKKKKQSSLTQRCEHSKICAVSGDGENHMSGNLLSDGTVNIKMRVEACELEEDDMWGGDEDEEV